MDEKLRPYALDAAFTISGKSFLSVLAQMDEGVLIIDTQGIIVFYNMLHGIIDGLAPSQVLGKQLTEVYNLSAEESVSLRCLKNERPILQEYIVYKPREGIVVNSINSVYPIKKNEKIVGVISFLKDYKILKTLVSPSPAPHRATLKKGERYTFKQIKGSSRELLKAVTTAQKTSGSDSPVMLYGETGTGKEIFAQSIHQKSHRNKKAYVAINCASIPENLFEGLLFGTRKGAYTGALDKKGLFEQANGGTLFLDEIDSMPVPLQTKLLRAIQERKIRRVGALEEVPVDIRIISSTSTPPKRFLNNSALFRIDLFYRLAVVLIKIPPLKNRENDIGELTQHFLKILNKRMQRQVRSVSREVMALFFNYNWPGNVRELEHVIEGAMNLLGNDTVLDFFHVAPYFKTVCPMFLDAQRQQLAVQNSCAAPSLLEPNAASHISTGIDKFFPPGKLENRSVMDADEKQIVENVLLRCNGKIAAAADTLGISRQLLYYRMKKYGLDRKKIVARCEKERLEQALADCDGNLSETAKQLGISLQLLNYKMKTFLTPQSPESNATAY